MKPERRQGEGEQRNRSGFGIAEKSGFGGERRKSERRRCGRHGFTTDKVRRRRRVLECFKKGRRSWGDK
jgi:hypothetical protein